MKKYLVKVTATAKANENEVAVWYYGKGDADGNTYDEKYLARNYGYSTEAQAKRNWHYKNTDLEPWLTRKAEIIAVEV